MTPSEGDLYRRRHALMRECLVKLRQMSSPGLGTPAEVVIKEMEDTLAAGVAPPEWEQAANAQMEVLGLASEGNPVLARRKP